MTLLALFSSQNQALLFGLFLTVIAVFLVVDLGIFNRKPKRITTRNAFWQTMFWIAVSVAFGILIYFFGGGQDSQAGQTMAVEYFSAYLLEKALSVDNIFVILLILRYFAVPEEYYHKVLFWGILGALVFRGVFIFVGLYLVDQFHFILYIFGAFLIYTGARMMRDDDEDEIEPEKNPLVRTARRFLPITNSFYKDQFWVRRDRGIIFTPLFVVLILIESTDLIFALDSIPAAFAVVESGSQFVVYTSNIFAVLGLRAMFFLLAGIISQFHLLQKGLSIVLIFIGIKMIIELFNVPIPAYVSFIIIIVAISLSIVLSLVLNKTKNQPEEEQKA